MLTPKWFSSMDKMVCEFNDGSLSQYMTLALGETFKSCSSAGLMSSMVLEGIGWTIANFENLSMDVKKYFLSVEKMSMFDISPT